MLTKTFQGLKEAEEAFRNNASPRYCKLTNLRSWAEGSQYDDRPAWFDPDCEDPLWERAPCIVYPVVDIACSSNVDLCLGDGKYPEFTSSQERDEEDEGGLSEDQSDTLDDYLREYHRQCRFKAHARSQFYEAQATGSDCSIHGVRDGKPFVNAVPSAWAEPELDADGNTLKLEIRYPFIEQYQDPKTGAWAARAKLYRRVIDAKRDVEYKTADADKNGVEPNWVENPERTVVHNFGFCPVVWHPLMKGATTVNEVDGRAIHARITDEIQAHDIARSQWHRGALFSEPQICEIGVELGYNPTGTGRMASIPSTEKGGAPGPDNAVTGSYVKPIPKGKKARLKGPGHIWQYENKDTTVEILHYPGEALKAQEDNVRDLRLKLQEALCVVFLDPENIKFAATTSGKALLLIKQKQFDRCDQYREDLEENFFQKSIAMQLKITDAVKKSGKRIDVPGFEQAAAVLATLKNDKGGFDSPVYRIKWGPYVSMDPAEIKSIVEMLRVALGSDTIPLITVRIALEKLAPVLGLENVASIMEKLEEETQERQEKAMEIAQQSGGTVDADGKPVPPKAPAPANNKPPAKKPATQEQAA